MGFPTTPTNGQIYTNSTTGTRYIYVLADKAWKILYPDIYVQKAGSIMSGDLNFADTKGIVTTHDAIVNAATGHSVKLQVNGSDALTLDHTSVNCNTHPITNVVNPTNAQDATTKAYVAKHSLVYGLSSAIFGECDRDALYYYLVGLGCFSGWGIGYTGIFYTGNAATPLYLWLPFTSNSAATTTSMKLTVGFANFSNSTNMTYTCEILDGGGTWRSGSTTFGAAAQEATVTITSKVPCGMIGIRITLPINSSYIGVTHIKVEAN